MALINCPECGKEISDKVKACPHCGYPLVENSEENNTIEFTEQKPKKMSAQKKKVINLLV